MNFSPKSIFLFFFILGNINTFAQDQEKTVSLVVSAQGKTSEEAKQNALRNAIEQAFGTFISSKTEVLNDSLVKDEIVSIANGNIQSFEIVSEVKIPDGGMAVTLKTSVSVTKLSSFCESKGVSVEFKGGIFAANIKQKLLNESSELIAIKNLCDASWDILSNSIDFELELANDPILINKESQQFALPILITSKSNSNKDIFNKFFKETLSKLSISNADLSIYNSSQLPYYQVNLGFHDTIYLRNIKSITALKNLILKSNRFYLDFKLVSNIDTVSLSSKFPIQDLYYFDRDNLNKNKFFIGINGLLKNSSISDMEKSAKKESIIQIDMHNKLLYGCDIRESNPIDLYIHIMSFYERNSNCRVDVDLNHIMKNDWGERVLDQFKNCSNGLDFYTYQWLDSECPIKIKLSSQSSNNIFIYKLFSINELEKFDGYKILKSRI